MKNSFILLLIWFLLFDDVQISNSGNYTVGNAISLAKSWDPDAGVVPSLTQNAAIVASSNASTAINVLDGNRQTHWTSGPPLPNDFIQRPDLNILYQSATGREGENSGARNIANATDGNENTVAEILKNGDRAQVRFKFKQPSSVLAVVLRATQFSSPIAIGAVFKDGNIQSIGDYLPSDYDHLVRLNAGLLNVAELQLSSKSGFHVREIAALSHQPKEFVTVDLGAPKIIGWVESRHWAGTNTATATELLMSADNTRWYNVAALDPEALYSVSSLISPPVRGRYIRLAHTLVPNDWNKVFVWELDAYDEYGPFGPMPAAKPNPFSFRELIGVNGIWGWGSKKYSDELEKGEGIERYLSVASHARNYHFVKWEVKDPDHTPDYAAMAEGKGTEAEPWLNWDREYKVWKKAGMKVHASIKFGEIEADKWNEPFESAYRYGRAFALHFGPTHGNGLVDVMEIGNEPWSYGAQLYREILRGMAKGAKDADPEMTVLPCALHAAWPQNETEGIFKNYMGARITEAEARYLDGLNVHYYSWFHKPDGTRIAVHPEHPGSDMRAILNDIRFRNFNMPGKPIFLSEWGWDSPGGREDCTHSECVSEKAAAIYAIRGVLMFSRLGISRLTWFFYANEGPASSTFTRSGLTSTPETGYKKKAVFLAFQAINNKFGDKHFLKVIREDKTAWVYLLGDLNGKPTHVVAWRPVAAENDQPLTVEVPLREKPKSALIIDGTSPEGIPGKLPLFNNGIWTIEVSAAPLFIALESFGW